MKKILIIFSTLVLVLSFSLTVNAESNNPSQTLITLSKGSTTSLKINGAKKSKIKWSTSNKKVTSVSKTGVVKAKSCGKAKITAKIGSQKYIYKVCVMSPKALSNKLMDSYDWQCEDVWNKGFCDIYHYIESGTDSCGKKMNINNTMGHVKKALKKKEYWNSFVNSVQGKKYARYKKIWKKSYNELVKLEKCLEAGTPTPYSNYYFPYQKYSNYIWKLFGEGMKLLN